MLKCTFGIVQIPIFVGDWPLEKTAAVTMIERLHVVCLLLFATNQFQQRPGAARHCSVNKNLKRVFLNIVPTGKSKIKRDGQG
jgi:hypothetical protein